LRFGGGRSNKARKALFPKQWRVCVPYAWPREQRQRCRDFLRAIEAKPLTGDWEAMLRRFGQEREDLLT
jgi:hypothetical protein